MIVDVYAERKKKQVMRETFGHLAPKEGRTYKGYMIWAYGRWGDIILLEAAFENLNDSPWLFEAMQEHVGEHLNGEGIYKWEGHFSKIEEGSYCFGGKIKRLDFKDIFQVKQGT
ncbi:hypothetical protein LCGC14_0621980 [marine sediment metagenome]|uniref:Uncharacterized protein n=1 Tax=marine sediment metagenome TaxID=412755 RepID=A0A0F9TQW8_9ZZZZ|nr:hypothetical protein [Pricia sp.]